MSSILAKWTPRLTKKAVKKRAKVKKESAKKESYALALALIPETLDEKIKAKVQQFAIELTAGGQQLTPYAIENLVTFVSKKQIELIAHSELAKSKGRVDMCDTEMAVLYDALKVAVQKKEGELYDQENYRQLIREQKEEEGEDARPALDAPEEPEDARPVVAVTNEAGVVHKEISIAKYNKLCKSDRRMSTGYAGEEGLCDEDEED